MPRQAVIFSISAPRNETISDLIAQTRKEASRCVENFQQANTPGRAVHRSETRDRGILCLNFPHAVDHVASRKAWQREACKMRRES